MEQIIPLLIAAVVFAFQTYANYKKEQEKARKRSASGQESNPKPQVSRETRRSSANRPTLREPVQQTRHETATPPVPLPIEIINEYEGYSGFVNENSTEKNQAGNNKQQYLLKPLEITDDDYDISYEKPSFNLRDAIIYSTILERPYK